MNSKFYILLIPLLIYPPWGETQENKILLKVDFEDHLGQGLTKELLNDPHIDRVRGAGPDGSAAIRVTYVGYDRGSKRVIEKHHFGARVEKATLSFDVCFDHAFQWVRGGKLHGLGPRRTVTGGSQRRPDGWSARIVFKPEGACATYIYDQSIEEKWGISDASQGAVFVPGQWHHVDFQVHLNTPGKANGFAIIQIDGKEVVHSKNVIFRGHKGQETLIQQFLFSTFHGGHTPPCAPVDENGEYTTVHAYFDNFLITQGIRTH